MSASDREPRRGPGKPFLSSSEVVERLGISKATLYAYVSRGLIRSEPVPDAPRTRRYRADDVERLLHRQRMRSDPESSVAGALDWGTPLLESDISLISDERLYYRGQDAVTLAHECSIEHVMALLWLDDLQGTLPDPSEAATLSRREAIRRFQPVLDRMEPVSRVQALLPALELSEPAIYDVRPETTARVGIDIMLAIVTSLVGAEGNSGIARTLQAYWAPGRPEVSRLIDAALILSADHELNASTFTVRCIASTGAPLHAAVSGGLGALRGHKHGGATLQAEAVVREVQTPEAARHVLRERARRGERLAGFGHRLYPGGDPRGEALLALLRRSQFDPDTVALADAICEAAEESQGRKPNIDFALVMLSRALNLPNGTAMALMALGRTAGWIAHAREEYARDQLIRPRARYSGQPPAGSDN